MLSAVGVFSGLASTIAVPSRVAVDVAGGVVAGGAELVAARRVGLGVPAGAQAIGDDLGRQRLRSGRRSRAAAPRSSPASGRARRAGRRPAPRSAPGRRVLRGRRRRPAAARCRSARRDRGGEVADSVASRAVVDVAGRVAGVVGDAMDARRRSRSRSPSRRGSTVGRPPSTWIAVNGAARRAIPEAASVAVAVSVDRAVRPAAPGRPLRRVTGSVLSTRRTVSPVAADRIPEPETATAWT